MAENRIEIPESHQLILKVLLCGEEEARDAFIQWQGAFDLEKVADEAHDLLPPLAARASSLGLQNLLTPKFSGLLRRTVYANHLALRELSVMVEALEASGIPCVVLGDAATAIQFQQNVGHRPMAWLEVAVPSSDARKAIERLTAEGCGWWSKVPYSGLTIERPWVSSVVLKTPGGRALELRWHVLPEVPLFDVDRELGGHTHRIQAGGHSLTCMDATVSLLLAAAASIRRRPGLLVSLMDAGFILEDKEIDWEWLSVWAPRYQLNFALQRLLTLLERATGTKRKWKAVRPSLAERQEERWLASDSKTSRSAWIQEHSALFLRIARSRGLLRAPSGFLDVYWNRRGSS